jgi:hypothetical protein
MANQEGEAEIHPPASKLAARIIPDLAIKENTPWGHVWGSHFPALAVVHPAVGVSKSDFRPHIR